MKKITIEEAGEMAEVTASYIDNRVAICEELDYLGIEYNRTLDDVSKIIDSVKSDDYFTDDDLYQITDRNKVEMLSNYKTKK